ncbi:hypothetical protein FHU33_4177 [Blastococcus colisei]|uniref:AMIN-like domain-containing protein n=1 Tax=Blastococcus colisei TaxID=1564162 RepID=A0A543P0A0_9ACTN|nr:hypothetical protein [Blastococcus colisei]TQN37524.1 hypothetical protein FHU33_4177 [Blastococcus colisei]
MKRQRSRLLPLLVGTVLTTGVLAGPAQASPTRHGPQPFCGQVWGSLPEAQQMSTSTAIVTDVRAGRHVCFDRLVIDLGGTADAAPSYDVRYVDRLSAPGSGDEIPLRGGATLQVLVGAPAYNDRGQPTYLPGDRREILDVASFETFRQVAWGGSFEGQTSLGIGTRARLPFRVFPLPGAPGTDQGFRLVIDVGHIW